MYDGLEWLIGLRQLGVDKLYVALRTETSRRQLDSLRSAFGLYLEGVKVVEVSELENMDLISSVLGCNSDATDFLSIVELLGTRAVMLSTSLRRPFFGASPSSPWHTWQIRHGRLGGLTQCRMWAGSTHVRTPMDSAWGSVSGSRSNWKFLEPSAQLMEWRDVNHRDGLTIWAPRKTGNKAPWPIPDKLWLETFTVFFKKDVLRPLSSKEWAQLIDVRPEWGAKLRKEFSTWRNGKCIPIRFPVEVGLWASEQTPVASNFLCEPTTVDCDGNHVRPDLLGTLERSPEELRKYWGWVWDKADDSVISTATKSDSADVQYHLWAVGGESEPVSRARTRFRKFLLMMCFRLRCQRGLNWFQNLPEHEKAANREPLRDCLERLTGASWFEWDDGSRLMFWEWPECWRLAARDGSPPRIRSRPRPQVHWRSMPVEDWMRDLDAEKLAKLIRRRYLEPGHVITTVPRFAVPKGDDDVRIVWDMSKNGVNGGADAPKFFLLGFTSLVLRVHSGSYFGDFDVGEMFNNFTVPVAERPYMGVEITPDTVARLSKLGVAVTTSMRWCRLSFGWTCSPYSAVSMMMRAVEFAKRPPTDPTSEFRVAKVVLNLPGCPGYDPSLPRVRMLRVDGTVCSDAVVFVDDGRIISASAYLGRLAIRQLTAGLQVLGIQDAGRKREFGGQRPRAWTGGVVHTDQNSTRKFVVQKKWDKLKTFLNDVLTCGSGMQRKLFESGIGFLIHLATVYEFLRPYLVGFYLAQNQFREGRDADGWPVTDDCRNLMERDLDVLGNAGDWHQRMLKLRRMERRREGEDNEDEDIGETGRGWIRHCAAESKGPDPPPLVPITDLCRRNATSLQRLTAGDHPTQRFVRPPVGRSDVGYIGTDASGEGFGGREELVGKAGVTSTIFWGYWGDQTTGRSSNWREMRTGIDQIRRGVAEGRFVGLDLWFFTDNEVFERAFYKGYSSSPDLYAMIEELWSLCVKGNFILHVVHVAGTRMIDTGIDGLSRGDVELQHLTRPLRHSVPLHLSPTERSPELSKWIRHWSNPEAKLAEPLDWIYNAQMGGTHHLNAKPVDWIWDLAPGAALHAMEELALGRTKRLDLLRGVIAVPALLMPEWYRRFSKVADVFFRIPAGCIPEWGEDMHEPLTIGIFLPSFSYEPWDWSKVPWLGSFGRALSAMFKTRDPRARYYLHEFWANATRLSDMPESVVQPLLLNASWTPFFGYCARRSGRRCPRPQ